MEDRFLANAQAVHLGLQGLDALLDMQLGIIFFCGLAVELPHCQLLPKAEYQANDAGCYD